MFHRKAITLATAAALFSCAGCIVTGSTYEAKVREVDTLRDGYASLNREKARLAGEIETLSKEGAREKAAREALAGDLREKEEALKRVTGDLEAVRKASEGSRTTREQFIDELLAKEKATGKRLQELSSRADACAEELARERRESADRDRELVELRKFVGTKEEPTGR
ncbi:MAG: hypothetical protein ACXWWV_10705 [Candidatus Deferrimicrobiaceae bacterium]